MVWFVWWTGFAGSTIFGSLGALFAFIRIKWHFLFAENGDGLDNSMATHIFHACRARENGYSARVLRYRSGAVFLLTGWCMVNRCDDYDGYGCSIVYS